MTEQHYRMTLSDVIAQYKAKLISSTTLLYYYLKIKLAPGWKMTLHQRPICKELGISKAAFYKGIQRLKDKNLIDWEAPNGIVASFGQIEDCLDESETVGQIGDCLDKLETVGQIGDCLDRSETPVDRSETPVDRSETQTPPKPSHSNGCGNPPNSYQIFIKSLSNSEREKFLEFGLKKAKELPKPPTLPQRWVERNFKELYAEFSKKPSEAVTPSQDWVNHPQREEWIAMIREGRGSFILNGGPAQDKFIRMEFARWACDNNLVWGDLS